MRLDREMGPYGKYVVFRSRDGKAMSSEPGSDDEIFVLKLRDIASQDALRAYAARIDRIVELHPNSALEHLTEYANSVRDMAERAGPNHPKCKIPD
jgi:hypothetical protein